MQQLVLTHLVVFSEQNYHYKQKFENSEFQEIEQKNLSCHIG